MFVALGIQHAMHMHHVMWSTLLYNILLHYLINGTLVKRKKDIEKKEMCLQFLYNFGVKYFSFYEELSEI